MDADGLPLVGPGIDFTKCEAIYQKRTLAFLNHFVTHTVRFLNKFSGVCEEKLESLSYRIQRLEITMNILEAKLSSIPGLENVTVPTTDSTVASPAATSDSSTAPPPSISLPTSQENATSSPQQSESTTPRTTTTTPSTSDEKPKMTVSQDPKYAKYFKMLSVGVPEPAVKLKMQQEGLDPNLLNNPNAPVSDNGLNNQEEKTEDDFSSDSISSSDSSEEEDKVQQDDEDDDDDDFSN